VTTPTLGSCLLIGRDWIVAANPAVLGKLKRVFPRVNVTAGAKGELRIRRSTEIDRDLEWFMQRYPLDMGASDRAELAKGSERHRADEGVVAAIQSGTYEPRNFDLAVTPRGYQRTAADLWLRLDRMLLGDSMGLGKQQPVDTPVLTPTGWRPIGDLRPGDLVIGSTGAPVTVLAVYPQGMKPSYRVTLGDGSSTEAGPEHLWTVIYNKGGKYKERITVTTDDLRLRPMRGRLNLRLTMLYVPMLTAPVQFAPSGPLPADPYLIGQLIANGYTSASTPALTTGAHNWPEIRANLEQRGIVPSKVNTYGNTVRATFTGMTATMTALGLRVGSAEKRIPRVYMLASPEDRVALFHGLMDGDGTVSKTCNKLSYSTKSADLAADLVELVESLGGLASVRSYDRTHEGKGVDHQVRVRLPPSIRPFTITSRAERYRVTSRHYPTRRVETVEYVRDVESVCIEVDAPDHLYVTERCILTHNTIAALTGLSDPSTRPALVVMPTHLPEQWASQIKRCFPDATVHICQGTTPYDITERVAKDAAKMSLFRAAPPARWPDFTLCPYSRLAGWAPALAGRFAAVVADEVQELRHADSQRYAAFRTVADPARRVLGMSGTPVFNYGAEFWNPLDAIRPDCLGSKEEFAREWCNRDGEERKWTLRNPKLFGEHIRSSGLFLARSRADVGAELPPFTLIPHTCPTDHKALDRVSGRAVELAKLILAQKGPGRGAGLDAMREGSELDRIMRQATGVAKAPYVADFLRMVVESGEPVICAAWHREVYSILAEKLHDLAPAFYTGAESPKQKQESLRRFLKGETPIFIMSLRSGAGIDGLQTVCRTAVVAEPDWSPAVHDQFFMRLDRDGQAKETLGYFLLAESGSDPTVADVCGAKAANYRPVLRPGVLTADYQIDPLHTRRLAEAILKRGVR
jgi:hypothetical protein